MSDISLELQAQVTNAIKNNQPLTIKGGGSKSFMGRVTDKSLQILDVSGHSGIVNYEPVELILTARAGTPLIEIENALAENNQMLAFEPRTFQTLQHSEVRWLVISLARVGLGTAPSAITC